MRPGLCVAGGVMLALMLAGAASAQTAQFAWVNTKPIRERDADRALRETLSRAAGAAAARLSRRGAFARDREVALPGPLQALRGGWNPVGASGALETLQAAMNHAAELGAADAPPALGDAIAALDFSDAVAILRSGEEAATQLFAVRSRSRIEARLRPVVDAALDRSGAYKALAHAGAAANADARAARMRDDVLNATLAREVDALLGEMAAEERRIRADPAARGLPRLREIFSNVRSIAPRGG